VKVEPNSNCAMHHSLSPPVDMDVWLRCVHDSCLEAADNLAGSHLMTPRRGGQCGEERLGWSRKDSKTRET